MKSKTFSIVSAFVCQKCQNFYVFWVKLKIWDPCWRQTFDKFHVCLHTVLITEQNRLVFRSHLKENLPSDVVYLPIWDLPKSSRVCLSKNFLSVSSCAKVSLKSNLDKFQWNWIQLMEIIHKKISWNGNIPYPLFGRSFWRKTERVGRIKAPMMRMMVQMNVMHRT